MFRNQETNLLTTKLIAQFVRLYKPRTIFADFKHLTFEVLVWHEL
jgi:hypothetical protein